MRRRIMARKVGYEILGTGIGTGAVVECRVGGRREIKKGAGRDSPSSPRHWR